MTEITDYMSWNIENFSKKKAAKDVFRNVSVPYWIATLILSMQAEVLGIMEITLSTGDEAVKALTKSLNDIQGAKGISSIWTCWISSRNVSSSSAFARRADKYALVWDRGNVTVSGQEIADNQGVTFPDRAPLYWITKAVLTPTSINCLLWHAPQPKYHKKALTIQKIADLADKYLTSTGNANFLISGDFNYDTANASTYAPLTKIGFSGVFDGERTTLTTLKSFLADEANRRKMLLAGKIDEAFLANAYDNVFLHGVTSDFEFKVCVPYVVLEEIQTNVNFQIVTRLQLQLAMQNAKIISDHMPIVLTIEE